MEKVGTILYHTCMMWYWDDLDVRRLPRFLSLRWQCCCCPEVSYELTGTTGGWGDSKMSVKKQPCFPCFRWKDVRLMVWCIPPSQRRNYSRGGEFVYDCHCYYFGSYILFGVCSYEQTMKKPMKKTHSNPRTQPPLKCPRFTGGKLLVMWSGPKSETWRATVAAHFHNSCSRKSIGKSWDWWTKIFFAPEFYKAFVLLYLSIGFESFQSDVGVFFIV